MKRLDIKAMTDAMRTIKAICNEYHGKGCAFCPANGHGRLCHSGDISCCAPHGWWGLEENEIIKRGINKPCPECGGDNIRFDLTATANGFAIGAQCKDCAQEFVIKHREAIRKMWNEGYFEEAEEE